MAAEAHWYVAHTYSGYENKVKVDIEKTIENRGLQDQIFEVSVPMQAVTEIKNGVEKTSDKKMFPGYVLVNMIMNDDTWYVIRNTRGVTGFVGPGSKPVPLSPEEMVALGFGVPEGTVLHEKKIVIDFAEGDTVRVISGAWKDTVGVITGINEKKKTVSMNVEMFGRETKVELGFSDVRKL
ncbi:MAG: transcription termination/antitermination factor NusG [Lachnospiraceae bacterium]|nr:transcription termination/antitermination factor NusG [Candidatus Darwinimomas equi]